MNLSSVRLHTTIDSYKMRSTCDHVSHYKDEHAVVCNHPLTNSLMNILSDVTLNAVLQFMNYTLLGPIYSLFHKRKKNIEKKSKGFWSAE